MHILAEILCDIDVRVFTLYVLIMLPQGGGIKRCFCLTSVCLSCTSGLTREQRGL